MKIFNYGFTCSLLGAVLITGCNANLDTKKVVPANLPAPTNLNQQGTSTSSKNPVTHPSSVPSGQPAPTPSGTPLCSVANQSYSQVSGGALVQWLGQSPEITSTSLSASALVGLRLNAEEGLYLSVVTDPSNNASIGLIHCDSKSPTAAKVMGFAYSSSNTAGIGGGDDPSAIVDLTASTKCPDYTAGTLPQTISKSLPAGIAGTMQVSRVRSNATESLYFVAALASNQQLVAGLLHCSESTPTQLDVLGIATSASKGATPSP